VSRTKAAPAKRRRTSSPILEDIFLEVPYKGMRLRRAGGWTTGRSRSLKETSFWPAR